MKYRWSIAPSQPALAEFLAKVGLTSVSFADTQNPNTEQEIANAEASVASAQAAYDKVAAGASSSELAAAQAAVTSAQAAYNAATASAFFGLPPNRVVELGAQIQL